MLEKVMFMVLITGLLLLLTYIDKKYDLGLTTDGCKQPKEPLKTQNYELRQRIETLERIVTEPKFELNQELAKLK